MSHASVLVTGASKGIGRGTTRLLAREGFRVFAGYRSQEDGTALATEDGEVHPLRLDVTDPEGLAAAVEVVSAHAPEGLAGLVNNAGMVVVGPLEFLSPDDLRRQLEVNVIGVQAVTRAFLPAVRHATGRVVHVGSINGRVATPFTGAYCASKFALEAMSDALRIELRRWSIDVVLIEPGAIETPIWETSAGRAREILERMPKAAWDLYGGIFRKLEERASKPPRHAIPPERVAEVIHRALTVKRPKTRYLVGRDAKLAALLAHWAPTRLQDRVLGGRRR